MDDICHFLLLQLCYIILLSGGKVAMAFISI